MYSNLTLFNGQPFSQPANAARAAIVLICADDMCMGEMIENRWLSVDEIAGYLGVKRETVYKWIERKSMPAHKVGRLWKFKVDEVDQWVRSHGADDTDARAREGVEPRTQKNTK